MSFSFEQHEQAAYTQFNDGTRFVLRGLATCGRIAVGYDDERKTFAP